MEFDTKRFVVGMELSYTVEAESADAALRAVLPMAREAEAVAFTVREERTRSATRAKVEPDAHAGLTKSAYKAAEVAAILGISRHSVYERVPSIRVGSRRIYPRTTIVEILRNGLTQEPLAILQSIPIHRPKDVRTKAALGRNNSPRKTEAPEELPRHITMKAAAAMLSLSPSKAKELFDNRRIYSAESYGKRIILRDAVEHFLNGGTAKEYVEKLVAHARHDPYYNDKPEIVEKFAREMREKWSN